MGENTGSTDRSIPTIPEEPSLKRIRRARDLRRVGITALLVFVLLGATGVFGARSGFVEASGGGYTLRLLYPAVTRPGLAIRWELQVIRPGGFDGPVAIATSADYFDLFDFNNLYPLPADDTNSAQLEIWHYDPPPGERLVITLDGRMEPARQSGSTAVTEILVDGQAVVALHYETGVMP